MMIVNRSAPPGPVVPVLVYEDVAKAIEWLCEAFRFTERLRTPPEPDGTIHHAQLAVQLADDDGAVILTGQRPAPALTARHAFFVRVRNVDAHFEHAKQFGARILRPPAITAFGERQYSAIDLAGYEWTFSESVADKRPEEWGAIVPKASA